MAESDFYWWHHCLHPQGEMGPLKRFTIIVGFIYLLEISRLWFLSFNICRDDHVHHHRRHFPEPGVRRLGERAKGTGGARIVEAHLQVEPESVFCNVHCTL